MSTWSGGNVSVVDARGSEFDSYRGHKFLSLRKKKEKKTQEDREYKFTNKISKPAVNNTVYRRVTDLVSDISNPYNNSSS